ncbi:SAD1 (YFR005C) [Zygosaccharomyces parabailii]|nr:SAD1 (YFR005C) [Zygosaccharomyces parabailii]CDH09700.1 related to Pre-mRNA-splicing factor SAD1 [Zygosaccharomyces bailii ISA1307]
MSSGGTKRKLQDSIVLNKGRTRKKIHEDPSYVFLETIHEKKLDFDSEKRCCVTLSRINCYCCLVCGKYFQGRQENTPAFLHSVNDNHHVFINFNSLRVYLLPDDVEVEDGGRIQIISRIRNSIRPHFNKEEIAGFPELCLDLNNQEYTNGFVGFNNNTSGNDAFNVVLLLLSHVMPVRNFLLLDNTDHDDELIKRLAVIIRKLWSTKLFKPYVSSEELLAYISVAEKNILDQVHDPRQLLLWLVNTLANRSPRLKKILSSSCQGTVKITSTPVASVFDKKGDFVEFRSKIEEQKEVIHSYCCLTLDLPPYPLFKDNRNANDLPQIAIEYLLSKFNGTQEQEVAQGLRKYRLIKVPQYLILHFNRFDKNASQPVKSRNQTLVEFSHSLELQNSTYTLIANVVHNAVKSAAVEDDEMSTWKIQLLNPHNEQWTELDGPSRRLKESELLFLQETYIQVWRKDST